MGVMTFSLVLYGEGIWLADAGEDMLRLRRVLRAMLALFSLPVFALLGVDFAVGAWTDFRAGRVRMDGLILIATLAAYALSVANTLTDRGEVYYETATMVLVLVAFGRRLEAHARTHGRDAAEALAEFLPESAHVLKTGNDAHDSPPSELAIGDRVRVRPGELVPADVCIDRGESSIVAAHVTGESSEISVGIGDEVVAGSINGARALEGRVLRPWGQGSLGRIRDLLDAPLPLTRTTRLLDRLASWLVAFAFVFAIAGGLRSAFIGGAGAAIETVLSVLLVACPCALGLATPLAYRASRASLARLGVLVRNPVALELAARVDRAVLDKTGTLTQANASEQQHGDAAALQRMCALVTESGHALAAGLSREGRGAARCEESFSDLELVPGRGVRAVLGREPCLAGRPEWVDETGAQWPQALDSKRRELGECGLSLVAYAEGGRVVALAGLEHRTRDGVAAAMSKLEREGIVLELASGDRPEAVESLATALEVKAQSLMQPADKVERLEELRAAGHRVLFVGDGVNDAPALRAADVGVVVGTGTSLARDQAQVELIGSDLEGLVHLVRVAKRLHRTVRINLTQTVAYNGVALVAASLGYLHPLLAVTAMVISSLLVSVRSYSLLEARVA